MLRMFTDPRKDKQPLSCLVGSAAQTRSCVCACEGKKASGCVALLGQRLACLPSHPTPEFPIVSRSNSALRYEMGQRR